MGLNLALISILPWLYRVLKILFFTGGEKIKISTFIIAHERK